jgi:hypothetical protein
MRAAAQTRGMTIELTYAALQIPDLTRRAMFGSHALDPTVPDKTGRLTRMRLVVAQRATARRSSPAAAPASTPETSVPAAG